MIGFCFDFDGTIIDSISIVSKVQDKILKRFDIQRTKEIDDKIEKKINEILMGENRKKIGKPIMVAIFKLLGLNFFQRIKALLIAKNTFKAEAPKISLFEGATETFSFLDEKQIPYTIITTSSNAEVADRLEVKYPKFYEKVKNIIIGRDDVEQLKPHPEGLLKAAEMMDVPPENCVMVGDMEADILLGKNTGAKTIGVLTGFLNRESFKTLGADLILESIAELPDIMEEIELMVK